MPIVMLLLLLLLPKLLLLLSLLLLLLLLLFMLLLLLLMILLLLLLLLRLSNLLLFALTFPTVFCGSVAFGSLSDFLEGNSDDSKEGINLREGKVGDSAGEDGVVCA